MALLTVTINNAATAMDKKSAEIAYIQYALGEVAKELGRGNGTVTSGTIVGSLPGGIAATGDAALGSWTYTPQASLP
jgi:hypothetical protein